MYHTSCFHPAPEAEALTLQSFNPTGKQTIKKEHEFVEKIV